MANIRRVYRVILVLLLATLAACGGSAPNTQAGPAATPTSQGLAAGSKGDLILATTTSTQDSGLLDVLVPDFQSRTGYRVKTVAVGTGQALKMGELGEADVLLVHAPKAELEFMKTGAGVNRRLVMHNDFIIVGPASDPAGIKGMRTAAQALQTIYQKGAIFVSRGDDSGTNKKELQLWTAAGVSPDGKPWYLKSGTGMGQTLKIASEKQGYTLTDRATYLAQKSLLDLDILVEKDAPLLNIYHVIQVNPEKFPKVNAAAGKAFDDYMVSPEAQKLIGEFGTAKFGQPLFVPDAGKSEASLGGK